MSIFIGDSDLQRMRRRKERQREKRRRYPDSPEKRERFLARQRERNRRYRAKNPELAREHWQAYREKNREEENQRQRERRAAKRAAKLAAEAAAERAEIERKKELRRAQQRRHYARHKEKCRAMTQRWLEKNPGYHTEDSRLRYLLDPEKIKARRRAYYWVNRDRISAARRQARGSGSASLKG